MIEKLEHIEGAGYGGTEYQDIPLLEYVAKVATHFYPLVELDFKCKANVSDNPLVDTAYFDGIQEVSESSLVESTAIQTFALRYLNGDIDTSFEKSYLEVEEMQDTLQAFSLDVNKFWYLALFVKDYAEDKCTNAVVMNYSPKEELQAILDELKTMGWEEKKGVDKHNATLTLRVGNKHSLTINKRLSFLGLRQALERYIPTIEDGSELNLSRGQVSGSITLKLSYKIYIFTDMMRWFLKGYESKYGGKQSGVEKVSLNKLLLISRMIYILGLSDDERYYRRYNENGNELNFLKNNIRRYEGIHIRTVNTIY